MKNPPLLRDVSDTIRVRGRSVVMFNTVERKSNPLYLPRQAVTAQINQLYTISPESHKNLALVSPMRCEYVSFTWKLPIIKAIVLPVALLIFKSGLNRIFLTVGSSPLTDEVGAATPEKMFLMLEVLPEIQTRSRATLK